MQQKRSRLPIRHAVCAVAFSFILITLAPNAFAAQECGIALSVAPAQVNLPSSAIPQPGSISFGEVFDVNYTSSFYSSTLVLEYLNGSSWRAFGTLTGNAAGFTEVPLSLESSWARFGTNSIRVQSGTCVSNVAAFSVGHDPSAPEVDVALYATLVALTIAFLFVGRKLGWRRFLVLAVPAYLVLSPFTGQRYDVYFLLSSGIRILQHVNPFDPGSPPVYPGALKWAYPPLYPLYSALSFLAHQALTGAPLPSVASLTWPGWLTSTYNVYLAYIPASLPVLVFLLKLPMVASAILTGVLLKRMTGSESAAVWWVANPLVILVAVFWGQLDPIATLLAVGSIYYFRSGKESRAYLLSSFGAAVKVWPALVIPIMLIASARKDGLKAFKPAAAVLPASVITLTLYASFGNLLDNLSVFIYARGIPTFGGAFTVNGLTWQEVLLAVKSPPIPLFFEVGIPAYAAILVWIYKKGDADILKWTVVSILIFFLTYNFVNPQYFYWLLPLLILQGRRTAKIVFTVLPLSFLALSYNVYYFVSPALLPNYFAFGSSIADQLKVLYFYQTTWFFVLLSGIVPTIVYAMLLISELRPDWRGFRILRMRISKDEKGLVSEPVERSIP